MKILLELSQSQINTLNEIMRFKGIKSPEHCIHNLIETYFKVNRSHNALLAELNQNKREKLKAEEIVSLVKRLSILLQDKE